jgi:hypothetical protein
MQLGRLTRDEADFARFLEDPVAGRERNGAGKGAEKEENGK